MTNATNVIDRVGTAWGFDPEERLQARLRDAKARLNGFAARLLAGGQSIASDAVDAQREVTELQNELARARACETPLNFSSSTEVSK